MTPNDIFVALSVSRQQAEELGLEQAFFDALFQCYVATAQKDNLVKLRTLATAALMYEELLEKLEEFAKKVGEAHRDLTENIIPSLMDELDVPSLALSATQSLSIKTKITANIPAARIEEGCAWLEANGHGGIIKQDVTVTFGTKEAERAAILVAAIKASGEVPKVKKTVNHQTLSALVREQLEEGADLPMDLLGVFRRRAAVVSTKKT